LLVAFEPDQLVIQVYFQVLFIWVQKIVDQIFLKRVIYQLIDFEGEIDGLVDNVRETDDDIVVVSLQIQIISFFLKSLT